MMHIIVMRLFFLQHATTLFLACATPTLAVAATHTLKERFAISQAGDFIVTAQEGNYSLLSIRSKTADTLLLEEISVPSQQISLNKIDWKKWVSEKAPGHTAWTLYEIDPNTATLIECFSFSKNGWLYLDESEQFLTRLLSLPFIPIPDADRKKIGPQPALGEHDSRSLWTPPLVIEGEKREKPTFDVVKTQWPEDGSRLALCSIELYFAKELPTFPFPYWLEVRSPHYTFKMRAIDSGHNLISPRPGPMPHRSPQILGPVQQEQEMWHLSIKTPPYFQKLHLFAIDLNHPHKETLSIPFTLLSSKTEECTLQISTEALRQLLTSEHRYRWALVPADSSDIYIESEETFVWKHPTYQQTFQKPGSQQL